MSTKKLTQTEFLSRCQGIYGNQYNFDKTIYVNVRSDVTVLCNDHGIFKKPARALLEGSGCKICNKRWKNYCERQRLTTEQFISKAKKIHENFYDYSKVNYINSRSNVSIICPIHGEFEQRAGGHLEGYGCKRCANLKHGDYRPWYIKTYFDRFPEKKHIPSILYLAYNTEEQFYKVGITTQNQVKDRIKYMRHYTFEIVDEVKDTLYNVSIAEQNILKDSQKYKPKKRFGGYTECIKNFVDIRTYVPNKVGNLSMEG